MCEVCYGISCFMRREKKNLEILYVFYQFDSLIKNCTYTFSKNEVHKFHWPKKHLDKIAKQAENYYFFYSNLDIFLPWFRKRFVPFLV